MNILFMGTPDYAEESLKALVENTNNNIIGVVTNVDKPKGRGMKMIETPVKQYALEKGFKVFQPEKVRNNEEFLNEVKELNPDLIVVVAYGKILPKELLDIPKYGCINVHGSLLPKYRGAAPIQWSVINGEKVTGNTTMFMDVGMDTGDMIESSTVEIGDNETVGELWDRMAIDGGKLLVSTVNKIEEIVSKDNFENEGTLDLLKEKIGAKKQGDDFTMAPMLNKEMAQIDWNKSAEEIKNLVRGVNPIIGAYTFYDESKIKIWKAEVVTAEYLKERFEIESNIENLENGTIVFSDKKAGTFIKTGKDIISILEIQGENSKAMPIKNYLNAKTFEVGKVLK